MPEQSRKQQILYLIRLQPENIKPVFKSLNNILIYTQQFIILENKMN